MEKSMSTRTLTTCALIAALYTALCLALGAFSYGPVQIRVAEALTLLPVFSAVAVWGVTVGCALSNLLGLALGLNMLGALDIPFGTAATLVAALLTYSLRNVRFRGIPVLAALPPVLLNAVVIGAEITWMEAGALVPRLYLFNALYVGIGQAVSCFVVGLPLVWLLEHSGAAKVCFGSARA